MSDLEKCVAQQFGCLPCMFSQRVCVSERAQSSPNLRTGASPMLCVASFNNRLLGSEITHLKKPQRQKQKIMEKNAGALRAPLMGVLSPKKNRTSLLHFVSSHCTRMHSLQALPRRSIEIWHKGLFCLLWALCRRPTHRIILSDPRAQSAASISRRSVVSLANPTGCFVCHRGTEGTKW